MKIVAVAVIFGLFSLLAYNSWQNSKQNNTFGLLALGPAQLRPLAPQLNFQLENDALLPLHSISAKVIHLNFWAEWCKPCINEFPIIEKLSRELPPESYQAILINLDDTPAAIQAAKKIQIELAPSATSIYKNTEELKIVMNVGVLPYHFVFDENKKIVTAFYSSLEKRENEFKQLLESLISPNSTAE